MGLVNTCKTFPSCALHTDSASTALTVKAFASLGFRHAAAERRSADALAARATAAGAHADRTIAIGKRIKREATAAREALRVSAAARAMAARNTRAALGAVRRAELSRAAERRATTLARARAMVSVPTGDGERRRAAAKARRVKSLEAVADKARVSTEKAQRAAARRKAAPLEAARSLTARIQGATRRRTARLAAKAAKASTKQALQAASQRRANGAAAVIAAFGAAEMRRAAAAARRAERGALSAKRMENIVNSKANKATLSASPSAGALRASLEAAARRREGFLAERVRAAKRLDLLAARAKSTREALQAHAAAALVVSDEHRSAVAARRRIALSERIEVAELLGAKRVAAAAVRKQALVDARAAAVEERMTLKAAAATRRRRAAHHALRRAARRGVVGNAPMAADCILSGFASDAADDDHDKHAAERLAERLAKAAARRAANLATRVAAAHKDIARAARAAVNRACQRDAVAATLEHRQRLASDRRGLLLWQRSRRAEAMASPPAMSSPEARAAESAMLREALEARCEAAEARRDDALTRRYNCAHELGTRRAFRASRRVGQRQFALLKRGARRRAVASARRMWGWSSAALKAHEMGTARVVAAAARRKLRDEIATHRVLAAGLRRAEADGRRVMRIKLRALKAAYMAMLPTPAYDKSAESVPDSDDLYESADDANTVPRDCIPGAIIGAGAQVSPAASPRKPSTSDEAKETRLQAKLERAEANRALVLARARRGGRVWTSRRAAAAARRTLRRVMRVARMLKAEKRSLDATCLRERNLNARAQRAHKMTKSPQKGDTPSTAASVAPSQHPIRTPERAAERREAALAERVRKARTSSVRHSMVVDAAREERATKAHLKRRRLEAKLARAQFLRATATNFAAPAGAHSLVVIGKRHPAAPTMDVADFVSVDMSPLGEELSDYLTPTRSRASSACSWELVPGIVA